MNRIQNISYPRSGHHLLVNLLHDHLGDAFKYADPYGWHNEKGEKTKSEPKKTLEDSPNCNYAKNHDFDLKLEVNPNSDITHIIQIRKPLPAIVSYFQFTVDEGAIPDTKESWRAFAVEKAAYWQAFYEKWVLVPPSTSMLLWYDELISEPVLSLSQVLDFCGIDINEEEVRKTVAKHSITQKNSADSFKYYDYSFFNRLQQMCL